MLQDPVSGRTYLRLQYHSMKSLDHLRAFMLLLFNVNFLFLNFFAIVFHGYDLVADDDTTCLSCCGAKSLRCRENQLGDATFDLKN